MIARINVQHRFSVRPRSMPPTVLFGAGGWGREGVRAGVRSVEALFGASSPFLLAAQYDLCDSTGRSLEPDLHPDIPGTSMSLVLPGVNCAAAVEQHGADPGCPWWKPVDPQVVAHIDDTGELGGWASAQVARFAFEFYRERVSEWALAVAARIDEMRHAVVQGWEAKGPVQLLVMRSLNGAVGSSSLFVIDELRRHLPPSSRVIDMPALLADRGRVTNRQEARAIQQAALLDILDRSTP